MNFKQRAIELRTWDIKHSCFIIYKGEDGVDINEEFTNPNYIFTQFTGLLDKNKKKIFEGDIIKGILFHDDDRAKTNIYEVYFNDGGFDIRNISTANFLLSSLHKESVEVIGNIFQDGHLVSENLTV